MHGFEPAQLNENFASRIYFLALRELQSHELARETCSETLARVLQELRAGKVTDSLPQFVANRTRTVIQEFRLTQNYSPSIAEVEIAESDQSIFVDPEVHGAIATMRDRMPPLEWQLLRMYYHDGLSKEGVSQRLGILPDQARLVRSRALKSFHEFYTRLRAKPPR